MRSPQPEAARLCYLLLHVLPGFLHRKIPTRRLRICWHGVQCLRMFSVSTVFSTVLHLVLAVWMIPDAWQAWVWSAVVCTVAEFLLLCNGVLSVYLTSVQQGIRHRLMGALCALIPIVNWFVLNRIIHVSAEEVRFEVMTLQRDADRAEQAICRTKYPLVLVHGVFFRDIRQFNYWGRIPQALIRNGATVWYGDQQSALSVADSAAELTARIRRLVEETGCEKVNVIAHSKGGLDTRYAVAFGEAAPYIASITTINTPHRGCEFADYLLHHLPQDLQKKVEATYNAAMLYLGDHTPDFMAAVWDLTAERCKARDEAMPEPEGIFCQSVGSVMDRAAAGKFPLNLTYGLAKYFDGPNDGLVSEPSCRWTERYTLLRAEGSRGISHMDVIDLMRENVPGFDVREFYVQLVADLKQRGL